MSSYAHAGHHPSQPYLRSRAELAEQSFEHTVFTVDLVVRLVTRLGHAVRSRVQRWSTAHHQAVADRMFWELALTDPRVMTDLRAIRDHAESATQD